MNIQDRFSELEKKYTSQVERETFSVSLNNIANDLYSDNEVNPDQATENASSKVGGLGLFSSFWGRRVVDNPLVDAVASPIEQGVQQTKQGYEQISKNPVAGVLNTVTGAANTGFGVLMSPFNVGMEGARQVGLEKPVEIAEKLMSLPAEAYRSVSNFIADKTNAVENSSKLFGVDKQTMQEIYDAQTGLGELVSTLAAFGGAHKGVSLLKGKLKGKAIAEVQQSFIDAAKNFSKNENWQNKVKQVESEIGRPKEFKGFPIDDPYADAFGKPSESVKVSADPRSRFVVNSLEKQVNEAIKKSEPFNEKQITDQINNIKDPKESQRLGELYNKVLEHNKNYYDKYAFKGFPIEDNYAGATIKGKITDTPKKVVPEQVVQKKAIKEDIKSQENLEANIDRRQDKRRDVVLDKNVKTVEGGKSPRKELATPKARAKETENPKELGGKAKPIESEKVEINEITPTQANKMAKDSKTEIPKENKGVYEDVQGKRYYGKTHAEAIENAYKDIKPNVTLDEFIDSHYNRIPPSVAKRINERNNKKIEEIQARQPKAPEEIVTTKPRSELPKKLSDKILTEAEDMKAEVLRGKVEKGKSFFNEDLNINGKFTVNTFPEWFREIQGDKKAILNALDKIIKDKGLDKGVMVERVKAKILEHLRYGKEETELHINSGKTERFSLGKKEPDYEITDFFNEFADKKLTTKDLSDAFDKFESSTSFNFGANIKETKPSQSVVKTKAGDQPSFSSEMARPTALQPKSVKKDIGEKGSPLFEQTKIDPNQISFGAGIGLNEFKQLKPSEIAKTFKENTQVLKDVSKVGYEYIKQGTKSFKDWSAKMIETFSEKIKPHLLKIWDSIKKEFGKKLIELDSKNPFSMTKSIVEGKPFEVKNTKTEKVKKPLNEFQKKMADLAKSDIRELAEEAVRKNKEKTIRTELPKAIEDNAKKVKKLFKEVLEPVSTSLYKISPEVYRKTKQFQFSHDIKHTQRHKVIGEYLGAKNKAKMPKDDQIRFDMYLKNGGIKEAKELASKYGFEKELNKSLEIVDKLADEMGIKKIDNYFPRMVEDFEGFVKYLEKEFPEYWKDAFSSLIEKKAQRLGRTLTVEEQATLINNALRGYNPGITLSDLANMKKRVIPKLDAKMNEFYASSDQALVRYIDQFTELAEARKFFGKGGFDINESIGSYIEKLRSDRKLSFEDANNLKEIMKARFNQKPIQNRAIQELKNIGIVTKLGQPLGGVLTQLKDVGFSLYLAPRETIPAYLRSWANKLSAGKIKLDVELEKIGVDTQKIAHELADGRFRTKFVNEVLSKSGFSHIDMIGKSTLINALWKKYQRQAKQGKTNVEFNRRIEKYFGDGIEKAKVLKDLREGKQTDSVAFLLYNELTGTQPITMMDLPKGYLKGGNWRVAYFLKTFAVRQLDFALNETVRLIKDPNLSRKERVRGVTNLVRLGATLSLVGASVDQLKAYIMNALTGKENKSTFDEDVLDNLLNVALLSKYDFWNLNRGGVSSTLGKKILPPMEYPLDIYKDIEGLVTGQAKTITTLKNLPVFGQFLYERMKSQNSKKSSSRTSRRTTRRTSRRTNR